MKGTLSLEEISDLRAYEREREVFRREVIALKRLRRVAIGPLISAVLENRTTIRFQIQEMARAEKMVSDEQIHAELEIYNPLIPGADELSLTMFLELTNEQELREWLPRLVGIEASVLLVVGEGADEQVVRASVDPAHASPLTREGTTASVHYVRLQLPEELAQGFVQRRVQLGTTHPEYHHLVELSVPTKESVALDWQ